MDQIEINIAPKKRGCHIITKEIEAVLEKMTKVSVGLLHLFIRHTSASLTINEDADPTVRKDFESHLNKLCPENAPYYKHTLEGPDDMPSHLKTSLLGTSLTIPINDGKMMLGTWQGIYLCEHRNNARSRKIIATLQGN